MRSYEINNNIRFCLDRETFVGKIIELDITNAGEPRYLVTYGDENDTLGSVWITGQHIANAALRHRETPAERHLREAEMLAWANQVLGIYGK